MKLKVGINLGYIGKTDAVGKNDNIMIYAPSNKGAYTRPFLFVIFDHETQSIVFLGIVNQIS